MHLKMNKTFRGLQDRQLIARQREHCRTDSCFLELNFVATLGHRMRLVEDQTRSLGKGKAGICWRQSTAPEGDVSKMKCLYKWLNEIVKRLYFLSDHTTSGRLRERRRRDECDGSGLDKMGLGYWGT